MTSRFSHSCRRVSNATELVLHRPGWLSIIKVDDRAVAYHGSWRLIYAAAWRKARQQLVEARTSTEKGNHA